MIVHRFHFVPVVNQERSKVVSFRYGKVAVRALIAVLIEVNIGHNVFPPWVDAEETAWRYLILLNSLPFIGILLFVLNGQRCLIKG